jgi:integrase
MRESGYSSKTTKLYKAAYYAIKRLHEHNGLTEYSLDISALYVDNEQDRYKNGKLCKTLFIKRRKFAAIADDYYTGNKIIRNNSMPSEKLRCLNETHSILIEDYKKEWLLPRYRLSTVKNKISAAKTLLLYVEKCVSGGIESLTKSIISDFLTETSHKRRPSMQFLIYDVKKFIEYLVSCDLVQKNLIGAFDVYAPRDRKVYQGFSEDEANRILSAVDRNTVIGKRDYAMLMLAKYTGIRGVDIRKLQLNQIFWEHAEIRTIQSKTDKPLVLPLSACVGNAIADYILNARPQSSDNHVFLRAMPPYTGLLGNDIVRKYADISGVTKETKAIIGFHSFRRAIGVALLDAETPFSIISEILGHSKQNSTKRYIAIDLERLRNCAMPMDKFRCMKEALC